MAQAGSASKTTYNEAAVRASEALERARQPFRKKLAGREIPREKLYPDFNRSGLGVALEFERMGNRPVSEGLEKRAAEFGFELEHLGTTLGTVIHGIDLRRTDSAEQTRFVRDALLERVNLTAAAGIPSLQYGPGDIRIYKEWPTPDERVLLSDLVVASKAVAHAACMICA